MANNRQKTDWTLKEISEWTHKDSIVSIPAIQRGLVWKPQQVELLWDSILRQFPIGSFTLSASREKNESSYSLLDGQQRWNAISLGYGSVFEDYSSARSILWFDLKPEDIWDLNKTTRKFFVRATTKAHPWGYEANDECSRFNTAQKREALKQLRIEGENICKKDIILSETYPIKAGLPLPLFWFLEAGENSNGDRNKFIGIIKNKIEENKNNHYFRLKEDIIPDDNLIAKYQSVFEAVAQYRVPTIYLEQRIIDNESESDTTVDNGTLTDIEILFARIGTGGTQITQNELIYSAIKAYWPSDIKEENDNLADKYMPSFSLISLAFRLALSSNETGGLSNALSVKKVRQIATDNNSDEYKSICKLYKKTNGNKSELENILELVDAWLTKDERGNRYIPAVLRTSIARTSPDVYLLLMSIAKRIIEEDIVTTYKDTILIRAAAFYLHWMVDKGTRGRTAFALFKNLMGAPKDNWSGAIKTALMEIYVQQNAIPLILPEDFNRLLGEEAWTDSGWRIWKDDSSSKPWWPLWCKVSSDREVLLYAQREYICEQFPNYDPAKADLWEDYNRPWDFDHIIPQDWIYQYKARRHKYSDYCCNWKDNNGNMAAIPFEKNRSKSNVADWKEYIDHQKQLLADEEIGKYVELFHPNLTEKEDEANNFAQKTFKRLCKIYEEMYNLLSPVDINRDKIMPSINNGLGERQQRLSSIAKELGSEVYFVYNDREYPQKQIVDWARPWMSVGIITSNGYYAAITMELRQDCHLSNWIEIGLRKMPGAYELTGQISEELLKKCNEINLEKTSGNWWHVYSSLPLETSDEQIVEHLNKLGTIAKELG